MESDKHRLDRLMEDLKDFLYAVAGSYDEIDCHELDNILEWFADDEEIMELYT